MEWFQVYCNDLSNRVLSAADDAAVGAWFRMLGNCYRLENGGCYEHCSQHSMRQWMSIAGVDREAVDRVVAAGLATWVEDSLQVHGYDVEQQRKATERKEKGREMANARWGHAASNAVGNTEERRGEEKKREEKKGDHSSPGSPGGRLVLLPTSKASPKKRTDAAYTETFLRFWAAYPRKVAKKDAWTAWRAKEQSGGLPLDTILAALSWQTQTRDNGQLCHPF